MGFFTNIWKAALLMTNSIVLLLSCVITGLLISFFTHLKIEASIQLPFILLGAICAFIALCGFWGVISEKKWMLKAYIGSIALIIILQILCIAYFIKDMHNKDSFKQEFHKMKYIHSLQIAMECCGANEPSDWLNSTTNYPLSCCSAEITNTIATDKCHVHSTGCWRSYESMFQEGATFCGGLIGFETLCIVATLIVLRSIRRKESTSVAYNKMSF